MFIENGHPKNIRLRPESHLYNLQHFYKHAIPPASNFLKFYYRNGNDSASKLMIPADFADKRRFYEFCENQCNQLYFKTGIS